MLLSLSCKQGRLELTEDGFLQVRSRLAHDNWREPASAIRAIDCKPGVLGSCALLIHGAQDHLVTMLVRSECARLAARLGLPLREVTELAPAPPPIIAQPFVPLPTPSPSPTPPYAPTSYPQPTPPFAPTPQPQPAYAPFAPQAQQPPPAMPAMETTVKMYKDARAYQRDLKKMQRAGWSVLSTTDHHRDRSLLYKAVVPFGAFSGGTGQIVVTYQRAKR